MAGETIPKIRLVRCPKCRLVLQEVPDFPVYKCGGCDTILVAKNRKPVADTISVLQETEASDADNDHCEKVRSPSSDTDCGKLDKNGSNEANRNENGQFQFENLEAEANDETLQLEGNDRIDEGSSIGNLEATRETSITISDNLSEESRKTELHVFDCLNTFETADFGSLSSELSVSDAGIDDQKLLSFKSSFDKAANHRVSEETRRRGKLPANSSTNEKHYATKQYSMGRRDEPLESVMHDHRRPRHWPGVDTDEYPSHVPFSRKASLQSYQSIVPSCKSRDEIHFNSNLYPREKIEGTEQENTKLLRMLHELQEQISQSCHLNGRPCTDAPLRQNHFPTYEDGHFYPRQHVRHGQNSSWSQQTRSEHMPFARGGINTGYSIDNSSYLYYHHQDWRHSSEQLHPPILRHNRELCRADTGYSYNSYRSFPSSTLTYFESDFSNQRYRDHELKRYMREKRHSVRRHLRPTAGGAPFIACYNCFTPLQLPADFLLFKRKLHQLRCGACAKVLEFSFLKGVHIVPYEMVAAGPPPSKVDAKISTLASCSHGVLQADPMSYSDDYGHSFCKSCFTDGDHISHMEKRENSVLKQSQNKHRTSMAAFDSDEPFSNLSSSEKVYLKFEELPPRTGGKSLHHLMGYSSPEQLINGLISSISKETSD